MQEHIITSYVGVGPLKFGMTREEVHQILGAPSSTKKSRFFNESREYWSDNGLQLTFTDTGDGLVEIGLSPNLPNVQLNGLKLFEVPGRYAFKVLHDWDDAPLARTGTSIFLKLGLAVHGFLEDYDDDKAVAAFAKGRWDD
ncbi:hypothetical protein [Herbaspirillum rubrisubalbicans]|uniref:DUF7738 domain-containing protein n=1 Tax=Herbaspirillum rubrisubalbicans TaxID=80842 RepID=A0AAD0UBQ6_9BURK|nr:hypothetical protein [Herbaspirillum rubrisubalbicans]ALU90981.1 hypothetical protein Hrubri_3824 [Herbaspirillum rubrisubalbicans M1]AYR26021.1 hypothetical protein RC54_20345 [Herbaspirillum rubrisubalbicans]